MALAEFQPRIMKAFDVSRDLLGGFRVGVHEEIRNIVERMKDARGGQVMDPEEIAAIERRGQSLIKEIKETSGLH